MEIAKTSDFMKTRMYLNTNPKFKYRTIGNGRQILQIAHDLNIDKM